MSVKTHDDDTIRYCQAHGIVHEAYFAMKGCPFDDQRVAAIAAAAGLSGSGKGLAGSLLVYCAGCKIAVGDRMADVVAEIRAGTGDRPFIGCFTFGEQGSLFDRNVHANLMISAVAFGR